MTFKNGDRVMFHDEIWARFTKDSRRTGRRGATVRSVVDRGYGVYVRLLWDDRTAVSEWPIEDLIADDPSKHTLPAKVLRERAEELFLLLRRIQERGCITPYGENADLAEEIEAALK